MAFVPAELTVVADDTIVWRNADIVPHTVTGESGWGSGFVAGAGEWRMIATPGDFSYLCSFHPGMRGMLTVTPRG